MVSETKPSSNHIRIEDDFVKNTIDFLPDYMQTHENFVKLVSLNVERFKKLDIEIVKLAYYRLLDAAEGDVLDAIGEEVNVSRRGQTDEEYRGFIKVRFLRRSTEPTRPQLVALLKIMSGGQLPLIYKSRLNKIHLVLPRRCLDPINIGLEMEDTFPINANLSISSSTAIPLVASSRGKKDERYGCASSRDKAFKLGRATSLVYSAVLNNET